MPYDTTQMHHQDSAAEAANFDGAGATATPSVATRSSRLRSGIEHAFGTTPQPARALDPGMGTAVARRTVFRPSDLEDFGRVADRVAAGNVSLDPNTSSVEHAELRNAIASGALITSGRHLQHGDADQAKRNLELHTNCATAIATFVKFYLLLNGSGVGRSYDDELCIVDWARAPQIRIYLDPEHQDYPSRPAQLYAYGFAMGLLPWGLALDAFDDAQQALVAAHVAATLTTDRAPQGAEVCVVPDSREGWAQAIERIESMAFAGSADTVLVVDLSHIRPAGSPIGGMQGRPCSGPISMLRGLNALRTEIIEPSRITPMPLWEQALRSDHILSIEVQAGGARRAARMATKSWYDPGVLDFIRIKAEGGLWTANHSVMVDAAFWELVASPESTDALALHAKAVFAEATRCGYINGEPGFINGDQLEDMRTGSARERPVWADGRDVGSDRYKTQFAQELLHTLAQRANTSRFPVTTNPCGEIALHVAGGYCVIADFAPLLACPVPLDTQVPGAIEPDVAAEWDARVRDSVRLGVRFLLRVNRMNALYGEEVARTNRIGIGPTGLHEWAWLRFGYTFHDLIDPAISKDFWAAVEQLSDIAKTEANAYADASGTSRPTTVTTVKPAGSTSKLFGLSEGVHLPARRQYMRWVQFQGNRDSEGQWKHGADPLLATYASKGYPVRDLQSFAGMAIVGFPTVPRILTLGIGEQIVTAPEASPEAQYAWLRLVEKHWIGASQGNQVSYTLKVYTDQWDIEAYRDIVLRNQPTIRCCAVLPSRPDHALGYEYMPEEEVSLDAFASIVSGISDAAIQEAIDLETLQCASGACPI